ncbi:T9SS type A sorting domain-containing protein [Flavobacterium sp. 9AF]|uniref:T9SS type A sorting domain-containing protein n=1 Tax=Flavobacterium sp. 9AF TaxID=2653142 RepID=UPI0013577A59|nr:T9SS type A sorting domain-containing protein [Flavobacterium sp. 9AF]
MKIKLFLIITFLILNATSLIAQDCEGFKTFTIGGWGANCNGQNPGCYRDAFFEFAFPNGLTIGCNENTLLFTSSQAVNNFLPSGSTPRALNEGVLINPGRTYKNVLAAQLVGITLAVYFDEYDEDFSSNAIYLGNLIINEGVFEGMTVYDFLELANSAIGGCITGYSFSELNATATAINENFDGGNTDNGFLTCSDIIYTEKSALINIYPNPVIDDFTIELSFNYPTDITIEMYNMHGQLMRDMQLENINADTTHKYKMDKNFLKAGVYFLKITTNKNSFTKTLTVTQ